MKLLACALLLIIYANCQSQSVAGVQILKRPPEFKIPSETSALTMKHSITDKGVDPWLVYSYKKPNYSFSEPNGFTIFKQLDYMQQFYVLEDKDTHIRIAKASGFDPRTLKINDDAVDYGWVRKHDMLLWSHCIVTDMGEIEKKAMIMNTVDMVKAKRLNLSKLRADAVEFYYSSDLREPTGRESRMFEIFFAYKITDTAVLLGTSSRAREETESVMKELILGWVPLNRVVIWDHRVAVEPNWDEAALKERRNARISASVFPERQDAISYQNGNPPGNSPIVDEKSIRGEYYTERMLGEWFRYAVYDERGKILKLGVTGEINTPKGELDKVTKAEIDRNVNIATSQLRNINIVFVIDGTNSMKPYFSSVSEAINLSMKQLDQRSPENMRNLLKFGAVVYRDFAEKQKLTEVKELTTDYSDVANFLNKVDARDHFDSDHPEAVYYGLRLALRGLLTNDDETNIIILVGDAGNHDRNDPSQVAESEVIELIEEKKCGFLAFQVHNGQYPTYDDFRSQVERLMLKASTNIYEQIKLRQVPGFTVESPKWNQLDENTMRLDNYVNMATLVYARKNQVMNTQILTNEIIDVVHRSIERTDQTIFRIARVTSEGRSLSDVLDKPAENPKSSSKYISSYNPALLDFFFNKLEVSRDKLEYLCDNKFQLHSEGYATLYIDNLKEPLFRKVLLLSRQDLSKTLDMINRLYNASTQSDRRMAIQNAYIEMLIRHIGRIDRSELLRLTIEEVSNKIVGLPGTNSFINRVKLEDITNPGVLPDNELNNYAREIDLKREAILKIYNESRDNPYRYSLRLNEEPYYWIEDHLIP